MHKQRAALATLVLILAILACTAPVVRSSPNSANDFAATITAMAATIQSQIGPPTARPVPQGLPQSSEPANTPPISSTPMVSVSVDTNCREGPDKFFDLVGIMNVGETAEAIGRNKAKTYYVIRLPSHTEKTCWLWYEWATVTGNADALPIIASPPTPTWSPKPDFTFHYIGLSHCAAQYFLRFQVENTGNMIWESYRPVCEDLTTTATMAYMYNEFGNYEGCNTLSSVPALHPGETGYAAVLTFGNPSGHDVEVTLTFCTEDDLHGTCITGNASMTLT